MILQEGRGECIASRVSVVLVGRLLSAIIQDDLMQDIIKIESSTPYSKNRI